MKREWKGTKIPYLRVHERLIFSSFLPSCLLLFWFSFFSGPDMTRKHVTNFKVKVEDGTLDFRSWLTLFNTLIWNIIIFIICSSQAKHPASSSGSWVELSCCLKYYLWIQLRLPCSWSQIIDGPLLFRLPFALQDKTRQDDFLKEDDSSSWWQKETDFHTKYLKVHGKQGLYIIWNLILVPLLTLSPSSSWERNYHEWIIFHLPLLWWWYSYWWFLWLYFPGVCLMISCHSVCVDVNYSLFKLNRTQDRVWISKVKRDLEMMMHW